MSTIHYLATLETDCVDVKTNWQLLLEVNFVFLKYKMFTLHTLVKENFLVMQVVKYTGSISSFYLHLLRFFFKMNTATYAVTCVSARKLINKKTRKKKTFEAITNVAKYL